MQMVEEFANSFLWQQPKVIREVNLQSEGIKFPFKKEEIRFAYIKVECTYSNDCNYFAFVEKQDIYIVNCCSGDIQKIFLDQLTYWVMQFSEDSKYLIIDGDDFGRPCINIYKNNKDQFSYFDSLKKQARIPRNFDFQIKRNILYAIHDDNTNIIFQTYNLESKLKTQTIIELYYCYQQVKILLPMCYTIIKYIQAFKHRGFCFLLNPNGKKLKITKCYSNIEGIFGLEPKEGSYRLYYVSKEKMIKKYFLAQNYTFMWQVDEKMHLLKEDLVVQISVSSQMSKEITQIEIRCFNYQIKSHCYRGFQEINKKGAFNMKEDNIFEFYYF